MLFFNVNNRFKALQNKSQKSSKKLNKFNKYHKFFNFYFFIVYSIEDNIIFIFLRNRLHNLLFFDKKNP